MKAHELSGAKNYLKHIHCDLKLPKKAIVSPLSSMTKYVLSQGKFKHYWCEADIYVDEQKGYCYVTGAGIGAPAMACALEILIALGVKELLLIGLAGSLQPEVLAGDIVLCSGAVADEGISAHYAPKEISTPSEIMVQRVAKQLDKAGLNYHFGPTWTTDAIFRETIEEVKHYQKKDILTVEMEASAFFAVCEQRKVKGAACFAVSDELFNYKWDTHFGEKPVVTAMRAVFHTAIKTLTGK